jgi:hypothetical protein
VLKRASFFLAAFNILLAKRGRVGEGKLVLATIYNKVLCDVLAKVPWGVVKGQKDYFEFYY